jgi:hypothetical protein
MIEGNDSVVSSKLMGETLRAEIEEIEKYKWYLGERLGYDPLRDRSMNDICQEWIEKYAQAFRQHWEDTRRNLCS